VGADGKGSGNAGPMPPDHVVVDLGPEEGEGRNHSSDVPAPTAGLAQRFSRVPTELPLDRTDVRELGLHLDHEERSSLSVPCKQVDPSREAVGTDLDFALHAPATSPQPPFDVCDALGVGAIPEPAAVEEPRRIDPEDERRAERSTQSVCVGDVQRPRDSALDL
jgi:hypothetical protein